MRLFPKLHHRGSALLIGMWLIIVLTIIWVVFLEKIWRFSDRTENIEQSNAAYYLATSAIERAIYTTDKRTPWAIDPVGFGALKSVGYTGTALPLTQTVPRLSNGNSPFDLNWNIISLWAPVQIVVPNGVNWNSVYFHFRIPNLDPAVSETLDPSFNTKWVVNWVLAASTEALFASGETEVFQWVDIQDSNTPFSSTLISAKNGNTSSGWNMSFTAFYTDPAHLNASLSAGSGKCQGYGCTLKLSLLRPLLVDGKSIPFLEYQIDFTAGYAPGIPDQYLNLTTKWYSDGFLRSRTIQIPQITTNTALDFTVLQ